MRVVYLRTYKFRTVPVRICSTLDEYWLLFTYQSDSRRVLETTTDAQGQYRFPPVPKSLAFELEMSRAGYVFTHPSPTATDFVAVKLAEIALVIQTEKLTPIKGIPAFTVSLEYLQIPILTVVSRHVMLLLHD